MGNRMSSLPIAQFCGLAPRLGDQYGAGRAAAVSNVAHARVAGDPKWKEMREALTEAERADLDARHDPSIFLQGPHPLSDNLSNFECHRELEVMLTKDLAYTEDIDLAISVGHVDMAWFLPGEWGPDQMAVMDIKANRWTVPDGPDSSLQLHAYGIACCEKWGCEGYWPGLFFSEDGEYVWGEYVDLMSDEGQRIRQRVKAAILNDGEASTGPHCAGCHHRLHCPEHTLKGVEHTALAELTTGEITPEGAAKALEWLDAAKTVVKQAEATLKVYAEREGGIPCGDGKVWKPTMTKGRVGVNAKKLASVYPEVYEEVCERGAPFPTFRRVKA